MLFDDLRGVMKANKSAVSLSLSLPFLKSSGVLLLSNR